MPGLEVVDSQLDDENPYVVRIYQAATKLFSERGYRRTSMREIAIALGQHPGSLYAHIRGKDDVLFGIINRILKIQERDIMQVRAMPGPPVERLRALIKCLTDLIVDNQEAATVYFHEWRQLESDRRDYVIARRDEFENYLKELLAECVEEGTFVPLDVPIAAKAILGMLNWTYQWYRSGGRLSGDKIADMYATFILDGFRKR